MVTIDIGHFSSAKQARTEIEVLLRAATNARTDAARCRRKGDSDGAAHFETKAEDARKAASHIRANLHLLP